MYFATEVFAFWACLTLGVTFVAQRAWQVLANVQRPSGTFASLSRRDNAWRNPRRPVLVRDRRWAFARLRTLRQEPTPSGSLTSTSEICRWILSQSMDRHTGGHPAEEERAQADA